MAINTELLVGSDMLQNILVDPSTGLPLAAGVITLYTNNNEEMLKNWYYDAGAPGTPNYIALPNPLTLSGGGVIVNASGAVVVPLYYPWDESTAVPGTVYQPYYIVVTNSNGQIIETLDNFPPNPAGNGVTPGAETSTNNLIINGEFWRNIGQTNTVTASNIISGMYYADLAPSQHDGFTMPNITFWKNTNDTNDTIKFDTFVAPVNIPGDPSYPDQILPNDITPEYYMRVTCGTTSATTKYIQIPIQLHIKSLSGLQNCSGVINMISLSGTPLINIALWQYTGTGTTSPTPVVKESITLTTGWKNYPFNFDFPTGNGVYNSASPGDDAFFLLIELPTVSTFDIAIAKPAIYLTSTPPDNDFQNYDQINSIICSPRTGDFRTSLNSFQPGWVLCNDGVIMNSGFTPTLPTNVSLARQNIDTWQLYNLIWNQNKAIDTVYQTLSQYNPIAPMYTSTGSAVNYGSTAISDWILDRQLQLTLTLGRSLIGLPPAVNVSYVYNTTPSWSNVAGVFTVSTGTTALLYPGAPVILTGTNLNAAFTSGVIYYAVPDYTGASTTQFQLAATYQNAILASNNPSTYIIAASGMNNGTNVIITYPLGGAFGQSAHKQTIAELAQHSHTLQQTDNEGTVSPNNIRVWTGTGGGGSIGTLAGNNNSGGIAYLSPTVIQNTGSGYLSNLIQPITYQNIFLKL